MATDPQNQYYDDQDVLSVDFDQLYSSFITSIDNLRSHFNALAPNSQDLNTPQYQESRCHTFYRMIGFPIVSDVSNFHSPGFDPNLNTDMSSSSSYAAIDKAVANNSAITGQFQSREQLVNDFSKLFSNGGVNAQASMLGSVFIRSFKSQFSGTPSLTQDPSQIQIVNERVSEIVSFYGAQSFDPTVNAGSYPILTTRHFLKPFIIDPRIDATIRPIKNKICAPFLKDKSQTKIFSSSTVSDNLQRPYIERVISVRFNNQNVTNKPGQAFIQSIIDNIRGDDQVTDQDLIKTTSNTLGQLYSDELVVFKNYFKIIRSIIDTLVSSIRDVQHIRQNINFDPIPDPKNGPESGTNGGQLSAIDPNDTNNTETEKNIVFLSQKQALNDITFDAGLQGVPDAGDFVFSNLDDSVFSMNKNVQKSYSDNITKLTDIRSQLGNEGIDSLRNIEIIMGEFSGLGLIDMIAIQAALWIMPENSLLGLIDTRAFARVQQFRPNINLNGATQNDVLTSLTDFEGTLKTIYLLIQDYYDSIYDGSASSIP